MNNVDVLEYRKVGNQWEVCDSMGRKAMGPTKEVAENRYRALHKLNPIVLPDLDQYKNNIGSYHGK